MIIPSCSTVPPHKADALMAMNDTAFLDALQQQFGRRMQFTATSPRARFPLALRLRRDLVAEREVWIGNAAQTLHPVSGQGFNLGIRDAWELASRLVSQDGSALGNAADLDRYVAGRRLDRYGSALFTDGIVRSFERSPAVEARTRTRTDGARRTPASQKIRRRPHDLGRAQLVFLNRGPTSKSSGGNPAR